MSHEKLVVLVSGKISSGKNTFSAFLLHALTGKAVEDSFARPLKELCRDKFSPLADYLNALDIKEIFTTHDSWFEKKNPFTRHVLQIVATDIVRNIDAGYWVRKAIENIENHKSEVVIFTDWRFPNEFWDVWDKFHVIKIRIERGNSAEPSSPLGAKDHVSETALDNFNQFDFVVRNDWAVEDLEKEALMIADHIIGELMP